MRRLTRRQLLGTGASAAAIGLLAGCSTPGTVSVNTAPTLAPSTEPITLSYWSWLKDLQKVADIYNAAHPDVQVETAWIPGGNVGGYQKLYSALAAGGGPDLAQIELRTLPEFLLVNGLTDLSRYGAEQYADRYDEALWNQVSFVDGIYAIPQDSGPMAMFYQPAVLDQVGGAVPTTWDEWAGLGSSLRQADVYIDCFPLADASYFAALAGQAGASWLRAEPDGWVINMTDEATLDVARFFDAAIDDDLVETGYGAYSPAWFAAASRGQMASVVSGSWGDALVQGVSGGSGQWEVAPMPTWGDDGFGSSYLGGSTAAVLSGSKNPAAAMEFAVWMTTSEEGINAMIEHCGIGWSPATDFIGTARQGPSEFFSGQRYNENVFVPASTQQNPDWTWGPITQQSLNILSDGFRQKASGTSLVDSLAASERQIITAFGNKGLSIRKETA